MRNVLIVNLNFAIDKTAVVDDFRKGKIYRLSAVTTMPGGKGVNVARALETLGRRTGLIGFTAGHAGEWIKDALRREGLKADCVSYSPGESRICYSIVDQADGVSTDFNEEGDCVPAPAQKQFLKQFSRAIEGCDIAAFCGRIAAGLEPGFFGRLIGMAKRRGKLAALDTSGEPLKAAVNAGPTLFKMNSEEFTQASGEKLSKSAVARFFKRVSRRGTEYVVVTDGPRPIYAVTPQNLWKFYPPRIKAVTPVGAGDSFMAGLLYGFSHGLARQDCARIAIGAAVSDCLSVGAGVINKKECLAFAAAARLEKLDLPA